MSRTASTVLWRSLRQHIVALSLGWIATLSCAQQVAAPAAPTPASAAGTPGRMLQVLGPRGAIQQTNTASTLDQIPVGTPADIEAGRRIYTEGILPNGQPLTALRLDGQVQISGATAACVLCHRRSGLGGIEGNNRVSPISGRYLFKQDRLAVIQMNVRTERGFNRKHDPYTMETLSAAIRGGIHVSGRELAPLMPRYSMGDEDIRVLATYLRQLSADWSPGVTEDTIRFATVITPDVEPARKQAFLQTIRAIVHQRNGNIVRFGSNQRTMSSGAEQAFKTNRMWDLEVWELQGAPDTWAEQLKQRYAAKPVYALISGLGANRWEPVHQFCEGNQMPCWFPSVQQVPAEAEDDFYSIYYTRGVSLEADVLSRHLGEGGVKPRRVLQVYRDPALLESAAQPLKQSLDNYHIGNASLHWDGRDPVQLKKAMADYGTADAIVFWLDQQDLEKLAPIAPPAAQVYFSGQLVHGETAPFNPAWKRVVHLVYPYQLPEQRSKGLTYFHQWLHERNLPLVDEPLQSEVYFALSYLVDTLVTMLDNVQRDFLIERAESELSLREAANAENQAREVAASRQHVVAADQARPLREMQPRPIPRPIQDRETMRSGPMAQKIGLREGQETTTADITQITVDNAVVRTISTTVYPRLSLAQFQRFASRGAYVVHFADPAGNTLVADTAWIVP